MDTVEEIWVLVLQRGHSGDGCDLVSALCMYDLRKVDLFVLSCTMVRQVRQDSISSELLMCIGKTSDGYNKFRVD